MPETGSQILSYTGNAQLGQGANANIPVIDSKINLDVINQTGRDISYLNHDNNIKLYNQKVKDRDTTLQMLADGQIASGKIDPSDRPVYDAAKKRVQDDFYLMIKNGGLNNPEAVRTYRESVSNLKNITDWAQSRDIEFTKLQTEKASQSLPEDIKLYDNHINDERKKDFWQPINPLQKAFNYDIVASTWDVLGQPVTESEIGAGGAGGMQTGTTQWNTVTNKGGVITQKQTTKTSPLKSAQLTKPSKSTTTGINVNPDGTLSEISYTPEKYWDYPTIEKNVQEQYISDPKARYTYQSWLNDVEKLPPDQKIKLLNAYNNRIADYSTARGIQPDGTNQDGSPHYPDQVKYFSDPVSGQTHINETPSSFFAKHALASVKGNYVEESHAVFNKEIGTYNVSKERANSDAIYKRIMAGAAATKARAYAANIGQQMALRKTQAEQDNLLDEVYVRNLEQQPLVKAAAGTGGTHYWDFAPIQADNSLPMFTFDGKTPKQLIPIGAEKIYGPDKKLLYYKGGRFDPQYILNGKEISPTELTQLYNNFLQTSYAKKNWKGDASDYLKLMIKRKENGIDVRIKGANGTTDAELSKAAQRLISNMGTKKGQTAVFDNEQPPLDESGVQESNQ